MPEKEGRRPHGAAPDASSTSPPTIATESAAPVDRLLNADEVAARLAVPVSWVRESSRSGVLPSRRLGRYVRYSWVDVAAWLDEQRCGGRSTRLRRYSELGS